MSSKQESALNAWCESRGLTRLPDSAYGEHVVYRMARVEGLKRPVRVLVLRAAVGPL